MISFIEVRIAFGLWGMEGRRGESDVFNGSLALADIDLFLHREYDPEADLAWYLKK